MAVACKYGLADGLQVQGRRKEAPPPFPLCPPPQDDPRLGIKVSGLSEVPVDDCYTAQALVARGHAARSTGSTAMNEVRQGQGQEEEGYKLGHCQHCQRQGQGEGQGWTAKSVQG